MSKPKFAPCAIAGVSGYRVTVDGQFRGYVWREDLSGVSPRWCGSRKAMDRFNWYHVERTRAEAAAWLCKMTYAELRRAVPVGSIVRTSYALQDHEVEVVGHKDETLKAGLPAVRVYIKGTGTVLRHEGEFELVKRGNPDDNAN